MAYFTGYFIPIVVLALIVRFVTTVISGIRIDDWTHAFGTSVAMFVVDRLVNYGTFVLGLVPTHPMNVVEVYGFFVCGSLVANAVVLALTALFSTTGGITSAKGYVATLVGVTALQYFASFVQGRFGGVSL